jgi:hypothetical protein
MQPQLFQDLARGSAQVRAQNDPSAALPQIANGREHGLNAAVVGYVRGPRLKWDIEIATKQDPLPDYVDVSNGPLFQDNTHDADRPFSLAATACG